MEQYISNPIPITNPVGERTSAEMVSIGKTETERSNICRFLQKYPFLWRCSGDEWARGIWYTLQGYTKENIPELKEAN